MNIIRTIEGTTLVAIGAFCATVLINFAVHGSHTPTASENSLNSNSTIATVQLNPVVIHGKRLSAEQKAAIAKEHAVG